MPDTFHLRSYMGTLSLSYLSLGVTLPAMSLIIVSKGYPLANLALIMIVYSSVVMLFEVPSGMFADMRGRKTCFMLGLFFSLVGTVCLFFNALFLLFLGFSFTALGRAYSSGSLDALCIETGQKSGKHMEELVFALEVNSGISLSIGALIGGWLLTLGKEGTTLTHPLLVVRLIFLLASMILAVVSIIDVRIERERKPSFTDQIQQFKMVLHTTPFLLLYCISVFLEGVLLASIEGYWQPYVKAFLTDDSQYWIFGTIAALIFGISVLGSYVGKKIIRHANPVGLYSLVFVMMYSLQLALSMTNRTLSFLVVYCLMYFLLGILSVIGSYLLNTVAKNEVRSSLLSLSSFSLQGGGILSNLLATLIFVFGGISLFWKLSAIVGVVGILLLSKPMLQRFPRATAQ